MKENKQNQKVIKEKQKEMNDLTKKGETQKAMKIQQEMMELTMKTMKGSMKYMVAVMIVFAPLLGFLQINYAHIMSFYLTFDFLFPPWLWWYILCSIVSTLIIQQIIIKMILKKE